MDSPDQQPNDPGSTGHPAGGVPEGLPVIPIPDHQLVRRIGRGGYGEVWLARNMMGTYRAVKFVHRKSFGSARPFERELEGIKKFEPISRSHDGFVDILHLGSNTEGDTFYYMMELGDDRLSGQEIDPAQYRPKTLASLQQAQGRLPVAQCLDIGISLTGALQQLHQHQLIHRDIKPANIIFVNGTPKLADIGLVAKIGTGCSYVGTEGFIPPEGPGTPQADLYSLGLVLYELSTGKDRLDFPSLPGDFNTRPDATQFAELNEIILRACQSEARQRYPSAQAMLADLMVLKNGQSVQRLRVLERRWRYVKKISMACGLLAVALLLIGYPLVMRWKLGQDQRERQLGARINAGVSALAQGNMIEAYSLFVDALELTPAGSEREVDQRLRCSATLAFCPKLTHLDYLGGKSKWVEFSADGQYVLTALGLDKARLWDLEQRRFTGPQFQMESGLEIASLSPDGRWVITAGAGNEAILWDAATGQALKHWPHPAKVLRARFRGDGRRVVTACADHRLRIWNCEDDSPPVELGQHQTTVTSVCFSHDGRLVLSTSKDKTARLWDAQTGLPTGVVLQHTDWVYCAAFSPDGQRVITACSDRKARLWETKTGRLILPYLTHDDGVTCADFNPDGHTLLTASLDGTVRLWDAYTQIPAAQNPVLQHGSQVWAAHFDPQGHRIVSVCNDGTLRIWDLAANQLSPTRVRDTYSPNGMTRLASSNQWMQVWDAARERAVSPQIPAGLGVKLSAFSADGQWLVAVITNRAGGAELLARAVPTGAAAGPPIALDQPPAGLEMSVDGSRVAVRAGQSAGVYSVKSGGLLYPVLSHGQTINALAFSPDGRQLLVICGNALWRHNAHSGELLGRALRHPAKINHAEYSPDSRQWVSCYADDQTVSEGRAQVWDANTGLPVGKPLRHRDGILWAAFSPDGRRVVTASEDFTALVWDFATGQPMTPPMRHEHQVQSARYSLDGRWIITASSDGAARIWDANTGEPLTPPLRHRTPIWHGRLSGDGRRLITGIDSEYAFLWKLSRDPRPIREFHAVAYLLSGQLPVANGGDEAAAGRAIAAQWAQLRARWPADFSVNHDELLCWHFMQAYRANQEHLWPVEVFHRQRLCELEPARADLRQRLAEAEQKLAESVARSNAAE